MKGSQQFFKSKILGTAAIALAVLAFAGCSNSITGFENTGVLVGAYNKAPRQGMPIYDSDSFLDFVNEVLNNPGFPVDAELITDINITDITFAPIGTKTAPYTGTFDGGGYTLTIKIGATTSFLGLFGRNNGTIQNLRVDGSVNVLELPPSPPLK